MATSCWAFKFNRDSRLRRCRRKYSPEEELQMPTRLEVDILDVQRYMPAKTMRISAEGRELFVFEKNTEVGIPFTIAIYYDPNERGYCGSVVSPEIEKNWKNVHVGHIFADGCICFGGEEMRTRRTLREAYAKSCLWAEGMAVMI